MKAPLIAKRSVFGPGDSRNNCGPLFFVRTSSEKGFTLVEVLLALCILVFGVLGLAHLQVDSLQYNQTSRRMSEASVLAQRKMEELMGLNYTHAALQSQALNERVELEGTYRVSWGVEEDMPEPATKTIQVEVAWQDGAGEKRTDLYCIKAR